MDVLTPEQRHRCMAMIKGRDTKPEVLLRKALFSLGLRYRLHQKRLPGTPDIVFPKYHAVVFIHGCFWHGHSCRLFVVPKTNKEFWVRKIAGNRSRDEHAVALLQTMGWRVMTVWECAVRGEEKVPLEVLATSIRRWLNSKKSLGELP